MFAFAAHGAQPGVVVRLPHLHHRVAGHGFLGHAELRRGRLDEVHRELAVLPLEHRGVARISHPRGAIGFPSRRTLGCVREPARLPCGL